ncbi:MAG: hypothetical protein L0211_24065 [Planctomycetaceae bacterium]|nr:hypothetical protein [Planctomycetaceae bacterium]
MDVIRFNTVVGDDQVIHVPSGVEVPAGPCEVTVKPAGAETPVVTPEVRDLSAWLLAVAAEAENDPTPLPPDLAENHDFYAHGKPRE